MSSAAQGFHRWVFTLLSQGNLPNEPEDDPEGFDLARLALAKRTKVPFTGLSLDKAAEYARRAREEFNNRTPAPPYRKGTSPMEAEFVILALMDEAEAADWSGRGGGNNRKVVLAALEKGLEQQNTRFDAGDREMAELAGLGEKSYQRARNRVAANGYWFKYTGAPGLWTRNKQGVNVRKAGTYRINDHRLVDFEGKGDPRVWPVDQVKETSRWLHGENVVAPPTLTPAEPLFPSWVAHQEVCEEPSIIETEVAGVIECGWCGDKFNDDSVIEETA